MKAYQTALTLLLLVASFTSGFQLSSPRKNTVRSLATKTLFATDVGKQQDVGTLDVRPDSNSRQSRKLGSQELLMLPRQYSPQLDKTGKPFPQMTHVNAVVLDHTPSVDALEKALDRAIQTHPLLRSKIVGSGEPDRRIDLFQMVRSGNNDPETFVADDSFGFSAKDVLSVIKISSNGSEKGDDYKVLASSWQPRFGHDLDLADFDVSKGPLWSVELHQFEGSDSKNKPCALFYTFNHAISDQLSANMLNDQILADIVEMEVKGKLSAETKPVENMIPDSLEENVLGKGQNWETFGPAGVSAKTLSYVAGKAAEGFKSPVILPDDDEASESSGIASALTTISGKAAGGESKSTDERRSTLQFRRLSASSTQALLNKCRENGVSITNALTAAIALTSSDYVSGGDDTKSNKNRNFKVLQSLDMRRFGAKPDKCETLSCQAGSNDLMLGPIKDYSGYAIRSGSSPAHFWDLAKKSKKQTNAFIENDGPQEAVRVFDFAMTISDMNNLVNLTAQSEDSKGRAYSAGVSNNGVYEKMNAFRREGESTRGNLKVQHGKYKIKDIYYATSHARSGCLYQVSCITLDGEAKILFHPASPIVSEATNAKFADAFVELLEKVALSETSMTNIGEVSGTALNLAAVSYGVYGLVAHSEAWQQFFNNIQQMKEAIPNPEDFWAAVNFWIFFAVGHPVLQPILAISDVLHISPGPKIADLVPASFVLLNAIAIYVVSNFKKISSAVNIFALSAFLTYVGAGLDGQAGLGDYNLQLDDNYQGQAFKGCPAYEEVKLPSMDDFDLNKYQGKWYEQKFHDWTQFKEVYDTTLDIKLTEGGKGWIDDFGVKGPAAASAPKSWDKSPVANGAHYFLFGRVDENDPPGILRESGFGVEFPNYIVDVQKDPETGEYTEAIQFQCLERGGVRVFEGINFMSRAPTMTDEQLKAMHSRAEKAGMYPYGASEDQMHTVARRDPDAPAIDNEWQAFWRAIGVDKLLELLTESIEDGGR